eukprot:TRINITY_DN3648_c0_g1_i10.p1 TRINITY_DN3648_c0_g1~~TRINITY_DN3648_c0_g1_i10.p1  ORF type:complete len:247 (+),score=63.54 TRINITY_DN3648_c0_g1_i10:80-742(+)
MAQALVTSPIKQNTSGIAFEINVKSVDGNEKKTPARERLESYSNSPLPSLLQSLRQCTPEHALRAEKARKANEQKRDTAERVRTQQSDALSEKRLNLEKHLQKASESREATVDKRRSRAGEHFQAAISKAASYQRELSDTTMARGRSLSDSMIEKNAAREAAMNRRGARAGAHNKLVTERARQHQQTMESRSLEVREQPADERFALFSLRAYEHYCSPRP